ncbi:MAG: hypothetical protein DME15_13515 [Candidatus Rokuibacteriota bacterium]|nr:MAG: hypothetical protein DME15_13515 [Candidatus Rokubacteria bacterium]
MSPSCTGAASSRWGAPRTSSCGPGPASSRSLSGRPTWWTRWRPSRESSRAARCGCASPPPNILRATVERVSYLGDTVDYLMRVSDGDLALRVTAPPPASWRVGEPVTLALAPEACVPLTEPA